MHSSGGPEEGGAVAGETPTKQQSEWTPARAGGAVTLPPGSRVAGYEISRLVGSGGMAAVYLARDEQLGRFVALKILVAGDAATERFIREARAVARVDHPHIIPVYAAGEAGGTQYIAMRYVPGGTLSGVLGSSGSLPPRRAAGFISPVASALDAAHAEGLVHRDVKPGNILVDSVPGRPEHPYLTDFGIVRALLSTGSLTVAGQFLGTPDYAAPEQAGGQDVDGRTDQYALACVAFEALTGQVPFKRDIPVAVLYAHVSAPVPAATSVRADLPGAVDGVLAKAMAKDPDQRYPSCSDFADALREALGLDPWDPSRAQPLPSQPLPSQPVLSQQPAQSWRISPSQQVPTQAEPLSAVWTAVVTADREYYEHIQAVNEADTQSIMMFPNDARERRIPLAGTDLLIGRHSKSTGVTPEIDLRDPPGDPGVHRMHARLVRAPDGSWTIVDLGNENGITVNGQDVPPGATVPLNPGDSIHLGAWTKITITRG
jgi:serine/threonine-protein kinase